MNFESITGLYSEPIVFGPHKHRSPDYGMNDRNLIPGRNVFLHRRVQVGSGVQPCCHLLGTGGILPGAKKNGLGVKLTIHFFVVPWLRLDGTKFLHGAEFS